MSRIIQDRSYIVGNRYDVRWRRAKQVRANNPFFLRPYINFGEVRHEPVNDVTLTSAVGSLTFSANFWEIKIENKKYGNLTKIAFNSMLELRPFKNGIDMGEIFHLVWEGNSLPITCRFPSSSATSEDLRAKIPFCYVKELIHEDSSTTILAGGARNAILACTFKDFHSLYIVSKSSTFGEEDVISIPFSELDNYEFLMEFSSQVTKHERFKLKANSWNDVELTWL